MPPSMSDHRYWPGAPRRDPDRSPDYFTDPRSDRSSASRRDLDRASDYVVGRYPYQNSRRSFRGGDSFSDSRRSASDTRPHSDLQDSQNTVARMEPDRADRAISDLETQLLRLPELLVDYSKWTNRRDLVLEGFRQRSTTYERHGGNNIHEPSVAEAWRKHQDHYKQEKDKIEGELTRGNAKLKEYAHGFATLLVKLLPIGEIKDRKSAPTDLAPELKKQVASLSEIHNTLASDISKMTKEGDDALRARVSPIDDRIQRLEEQMTTLLDSQKAQEANFVKLTKENEDQRARIASHEARATDLAVLKTQQEQIQTQLNNRVHQDKEVEVLKQENEALKTQVSAFQTQLADLVKRIDSQQADFSKSLQEATTQFGGDSTFANLDEQVKALETQVKEHEKVFSNIDAEEYAEAVTKLIKYPDYPELKKILDVQESGLQHLSSETKRLSSNLANVKLEAGNTSRRFAAVEDKVEAGLKVFSDRVIETCGTAVEEVKASTETTVQGLRQDHRRVEQGLGENYKRVENALTMLQTEVRENHSVHEMMIIGLDEQFKNMSTLEMANIILDNLKRLPTNVVPLDVQNFHERLVDLEAFRQEQTRRALGWHDGWVENLQRITNPKRNLAEDDDGLDQPEKRQRLEAANMVNEMGCTG